MSREEEKDKRAKRLGQKLRHMSRQMRIRRAHKFDDGRLKDMEDAHKYHKTSGVTCGNPNCVMCGNPRKFWNERTIQEERFIQTEKWITE